MTAPVSQHSPILAGGIALVTVAFEVDTGLRDVQTFVANLVGSAIVANQESILLVEKTGGPGIDDRPTAFYTLRLFKGGTAHGAVGDTELSANWLALGQ